MAALYHSAVITIAATLGLTRLEENAGLILLGFVTFSSLQLLSPLIFSRLLPSHYPQLSARNRTAWDVHFVAFVHALYSAPVSGWLLLHRDDFPSLAAQPLVGYEPIVAKVAAFSNGYFLWDTIVSVFSIGGSGGFGFILHGVGCFTAFLNAQRPFALYFLPVFLFWEASSIFLNIHWALDKVGMTGTWWQLINGVILVLSFFLVRIVVGFYSSYQFFYETSKFAVTQSTPAWVINGYRIANVALNTLNTYWLTQMIKSVRKRFDAPAGGAKPDRKKRT